MGLTKPRYRFDRRNFPPPLFVNDDLDGFDDGGDLIARLEAQRFRRSWPR
jgi:hypothetical protein